MIKENAKDIEHAVIEMTDIMLPNYEYTRDRLADMVTKFCAVNILDIDATIDMATDIGLITSYESPKGVVICLTEHANASVAWRLLLKNNEEITSPYCYNSFDTRMHQYYQILRPGAHGLDHILRVLANIDQILLRISDTDERKEINYRVLRLAAWLHDIISLPKDSKNRYSASYFSAIQAEVILRQYSDITIEECASVCHCILTHSFSAGIPPKTIEAKILQDADRIDALGAIGIARCFMCAGEMGHSLYHADDPFCTIRNPDDSVSAVDHFYTKLLTLQDTMQTNPGYMLAKERTNYMRNFLYQLKQEIG